MDNHPFTKSITIDGVTRIIVFSKASILLADKITVELSLADKGCCLAQWDSAIADYKGNLPQVASEPIFFKPSREVFMAKWVALQTNKEQP